MSPYFQNTFARAFGTFPLKGADLSGAVQLALKTGYRAFDTAQFYDNERQLGQTLKASNVPRAELLITTKVANSQFTDELFLPSVEVSLNRLDCGPVDVLLLHWPPTDGNVVPSLKMLQQARDEGFTRHIGVSNYTAAMMRTAVQTVDDPIVTNQVEFHPMLDQTTLLAAAVETGIPLSSYCSVARGKVLNEPVVVMLASTHTKSPAQIVLRWILQKGVSVNTMSTKAQNIQANFDIVDFELSDSEMQQLDSLNARNYRIVNKSIVPWAPEWD